jgi:glucose-1-phosphate thymidylyltransferase
MRGVILAGGSGKRLRPTTKVTNKHLLPVHDKPMIYYPLQTLKDAGIKKIMVVTGNESAGDFLKLLGSGKEFGVEFTYRVQDGSMGIANALSLAQDFVGKERFVVILGDNLFEDNFKEHIEAFRKSDAQACVFLKEVPDPERFGVAEVKADRIVRIVEKPEKPKTNTVTTGLYLYSPDVFDIIRTLKPSARGEYEITDVNNAYVKRDTMSFYLVKGFWSDMGTFKSMYRATKFLKQKDNESKKTT